MSKSPHRKSKSHKAIQPAVSQLLSKKIHTAKVVLLELALFLAFIVELLRFLLPILTHWF